MCNYCEVTTNVPFVKACTNDRYLSQMINARNNVKLMYNDFDSFYN